MFSRGRTNATKGQMADATWRAGFARLAPLNLSFEAWLYHPQLMELADLARAFPQTTIILNHVGGPLGIGPIISCLRPRRLNVVNIDDVMNVVVSEIASFA